MTSPQTSARSVAMRSWMAVSILIVGMVSVPADHATAVAPQDDGRMVPTGRKGDDGRIYAPQSTRPARIDLHLADPINTAQLRQFADMLNLSVAQFVQFRSLHETYMREDAEFRATRIEEIGKQSEGVAQLMIASPRPTAAYAEASAALWRERNDAAEELYAREDQFFEQLRPYLTPDQLPGLQRVKDMRLRQRARATAPSYPGSNLDLIEELGRLRSNGFDLQPKNRDEFELILSEYERKATSLYQRALPARIQHVINGTNIAGRMATLYDADLEHDEHLATEIELRAERRENNESVAQVNKAIHDLNREYVERFSTQLPDETAEMLRDGFLSVYRVVYPDPFNIEELLATAIALETLTADQASLLNIVRDDFVSRRDQLSGKMEEEYLDWWYHVETRSGYEFAACHEYQARMLKLQLQRRENAERALATVTSLLSDEQRAPLSSFIQRYEQQVEQFKETRDKLAIHHMDWPHPYDR